MNPLSKKVVTGTVGELLVQLRLLQYNVQGAPPLKDSGNDLIAVRGEAIRALQVRTTDGNSFRVPDRLFHAVVFVKLDGEGSQLYLDNCRIFMLLKSEIQKTAYNIAELDQYELSPDIINKCFPQPAVPQV